MSYMPHMFRKFATAGVSIGAGAPLLSKLNQRKGFHNSCKSNCEGELNKGSAPIISTSNSFSSNYSKIYRCANQITYPANNPPEDKFINCKKRGGVHLVGVFDGHGGHQVSTFVSTYIGDRVFDAVKPVHHADDKAMERAFLDVFDSIEKEFIDIVSYPYRQGFGNVASVGSCALLAYLKEDRLIVANCGDSRAVLARSINKKEINVEGKDSSSSSSASEVRQDGGKGEEAENERLLAVRITRDHNARMAEEQAKLIEEHPGESDVYVCKSKTACYVKGRLQLTRSFGDLYLKYHEFNAPPNVHKTAGRHIPPPYTPPYVTHIPEIHQLKLEDSDKFLVIGTDGLWDFLSDQEAVDIVKGCVTAGEYELAAAKLLQRTLEKAAEECGMTVEALMKLPQGKERRSRHDDTTIVVVYF